VHPSDATKANLANPTFTGTVVVPDIATASTNNTSAANTKFVQSAIDAKLTSVMKYKGSVANQAALLALTGVAVGDTYNLTDSGKNYAFKGGTISAIANWDILGDSVDLSSYQLATQAVTLGATESTAKFATTALSQTISTWLSQIGQKINGIITALGTKVDKVTGKSLVADTEITRLSGMATGATANAKTATVPKANGTAAVGSETTYAAGNHVHPTDTSRQAALSVAQLAAADSGFSANEKALFDTLIFADFTVTFAYGTYSVPIPLFLQSGVDVYYAPTATATQKAAFVNSNAYVNVVGGKALSIELHGDMTDNVPLVLAPGSNIIKNAVYSGSAPGSSNGLVPFGWSEITGKPTSLAAEDINVNYSYPANATTATISNAAIKAHPKRVTVSYSAALTDAQKTALAAANLVATSQGTGSIGLKVTGTTPTIALPLVLYCEQ
jgi:hypothetical protein